MGVTVGVRATRQSQTVVNVSENCSNFQPSSERVNCDSAVGHPLPYLFTPGVTPWERGRPVFVASSRARCPRSQEKCERLPFTSTPSDSVCVFSRAAISVIAGRERAGMPAHPAGGDARAPGGRGRPRTRRAGTPAHPAGTWCNPAARRYRASGRRRCRCPRWRQRPQRRGVAERARLIDNA
jgi:hypothetical protein